MKNDKFLPTRQSLLSRLKRWDDEESWRDFFGTYWRLIYRSALRFGLSETEAQDVVQETVIAVAGKMPEFRYDPKVDSFKGWLLYLTRKAIAKHYRRRRKELGSSNSQTAMVRLTPDIEQLPDPAGSELETIWEREWEENLKEAALEHIRREVNPKQYQVFDYYVLQQWPVKEVVRTLGVSAAAVYMAKYRISNLLRKEISKLARGEIRG